MRRLLSFFVLPVLAGVLAACGGGEALDPIAAAAAKTQAEGSIRVTMATSMKIVGREPLAVNGEGKGIFNNDNGSGRMTFTTRGDGGEGADLDFVYVAPVMYMRSPQFESELPDGKSWMKIDLSRTGKELGFDFETLLNARPAYALAALEATAGEVKEVGTDFVRGVEATQYRTTIDLQKVAGESPAELRELMSRAAERTGVTRVPIQVWIDNDGLVRRFAQTWDQKLPQGAGHMQIVTAMDFYDFGPSIQVSPLRSGDVFDATPLAGADQPRG